MTEPLELSLSQRFESERLTRLIEESTNLQDLKKISKVLLDGWMTQKAACQWMIKQSLARPTVITDEMVSSVINSVQQK